jgi:hypothetical protein
MEQDSGKFKALIDHLNLVDKENSNGTMVLSPGLIADQTTNTSHADWIAS